jgi:CBS domain-containing protein
MLAHQLINHTIPALDPTSSVSFALESMDDYRIGQMIIANQGQYLGLLSEDVLLESLDDSMPISRLIPQFRDVYCLENQHVLECISLVQIHQLEAIAVLDESLQYLGTISSNDLYRELATIIGSKEIGATLVLSLSKRDYSLSEICRLIEQNETKVISSFYNEASNGQNQGYLTLKLNRQQISGVVATLERFGYKIESVFSSDPIQTSERDRLDMLIHYLNI